FLCFFFSSRRRHTRFSRDWSSDVCSSDLHRRHLVVGDGAVRVSLDQPADLVLGETLAVPFPLDEFDRVHLSLPLDGSDQPIPSAGGSASPPPRPAPSGPPRPRPAAARSGGGDRERGDALLRPRPSTRAPPRRFAAGTCPPPGPLPGSRLPRRPPRR